MPERIEAEILHRGAKLAKVRWSTGEEAMILVSLLPRHAGKVCPECGSSDIGIQEELGHVNGGPLWTCGRCFWQGGEGELEEDS